MFTLIPQLTTLPGHALEPPRPMHTVVGHPQGKTEPWWFGLYLGAPYTLPLMITQT